MTKRSPVLAIGACAALGTGAILAQAPLAALDYAEIEQLSARYAHAIDRCTNGGYDYADLFVNDGEFAVADDWSARLRGRLCAYVPRMAL